MQAKRREAVLKTHLLRDKLSLNDEIYKSACLSYFDFQLDLDLPAKKADVTSKICVAEDAQSSVELIVKQDGMIAGLEEALFFLKAQDGIDKAFSDCIDGEFVKKGRRCLYLEGNSREILKLERMLLNLLQRMSGIATYTNELVHISAEANPYTLLCPTRKTLFGPLDKKAVMLGAGGTHRVYLSDAILVKENHFKGSDYDLETLLLKVASQKGELAFIEVEVETQAQTLAVCKHLSEIRKRKNIRREFVIMLDNFLPHNIMATLEALREANLYDEFYFEASGGINKQTLPEYAKTAVDIISMGALTNKAHALDISMLLL